MHDILRAQPALECGSSSYRVVIGWRAPPKRITAPPTTTERSNSTDGLHIVKLDQIHGKAAASRPHSKTPAAITLVAAPPRHPLSAICLPPTDFGVYYLLAEARTQVHPK
ncbi:MAG: hypothetical protein P4N24_15075 [Acidobacteriota bacterium]|nr:hypothetical protein [Acidobacteriota bacterium]